jgi:hypothetical protein
LTRVGGGRLDKRRPKFGHCLIGCFCKEHLRSRKLSPGRQFAGTAKGVHLPSRRISPRAQRGLHDFPSALTSPSAQHEPPGISV